jgi:hypothetical protein
MITCFVATAFAGEVVLRNDTSFDDTYTPGDDVVIHLVYPECAVSVLTPDAADLPLALTTVDVLYASGNGSHLGDLVYTEVGLELVPTGGVPTGTTFAWGPETFVLTVSNDALNELDLDDPHSGWNALWMTEGSVAVHVCTPDPASGEAWAAGTGVMVDTNSPDAGNWMYTNAGGYDYFELSDLGVPGSWIIRASTVAGGGGGDDTGGGGNGDGSGGDDSGVETDAPSIDSVVPNATTEGTAEPVAVIGAGLAGATTIYFGGLPGSALAVTSDTTVQVTSPSGLPVGVHDVMAELDDGSTATFPGAFTVSAEQSIATANDDDGGGCGCGTHGSSLGWLAIGLGAVIVGRRRH